MLLEILTILLIGLLTGVKLLDPLRSSEARGKIGGVIHSTSRGVKYAKVFTSPAQPRTARQLAVRAIMMIVTRAWQALLSTERTAWNDYAAAHPEIDWTGQSIHKSGANWHSRCNFRLKDGGFAVITEPPSAVAPDALAAFVAADGIGESVITWTASPIGPLYAEIYRLGPISAGVTPKREKAVFAYQATKNSGTCTISGLSPGTHAFWGRVMDSDSGLISTYQLDSAVVT